MMLRNSTARGRELGSELRRVREQAGHTGHELAAKLGWSASKVSRLETGGRQASEVDVATYVAFCGVTGAPLTDLVRLAREVDDGYRICPHEEPMPDELRALSALETTADMIFCYEPLVLPGLAQTEDYARALFRETGLVASERIDALVRTRIRRQSVLAFEYPAEIAFYVHEHALHTAVGRSRVMHDQMFRLMFLADIPHCQVRVVPASANARIGTGGPFSIFEHPEHHPVVYVEQLTTSLFLEKPDDIAAYRKVMQRIRAHALNEGESRSYLARLASDYDLRE